MAIEKMRLVNILSDQVHLSDVLLRFIELDNFHPVPASRIADKVGGLTTLNEENPYTELLTQFQEISHDMELELPEVRMREQDYNLMETREYIGRVYDQYKKIATVKEDLLKVIQENKDALFQLNNIETLDVSFDDLFSCKFIKIRFGRLPLDSVDKLKYYNNRPFIFKSFSQDKAYSWCVYITTNKYEGEVDNIFSSLYFERIRIPDFVHGTPDSAKEMIQEEIDTDYKQLSHLDEEMLKLKESCKDRFAQIKGELEFLNRTYEARQFVLCLGERFSISGFVAKRDVADVVKTFEDLEGVEIEDRPASSDMRLTPPTKLRNGWFARPFVMFVEMYGTPGYRDFDPTPFVALTYTLLFGIMFGDVGQGLVLSLVGYIAYKWKHMQLGEVGVRIGMSSAFFGLVYGSVFGNEEILTPLYTKVFGLAGKPIEVLDGNFTMPLLICTVAIGAVLIVTCICMNIFLNAKRRDYGEMLFSQNGISGLVFYGAILVGAALQMGFGVAVFSLPYVLLLIVLPLFLIFMKEPLIRKMEKQEMFPDGFGGFFTESFFELFEVCLSFVANTMSFLRIGGFVLSHAGMMLVVTTLSHMVGGGSLAVMIFGNIFVMAMEGMIVGIQVLRLEFYEMFSRYFEGNGYAFQSLKNSD